MSDSGYRNVYWMYICASVPTELERPPKRRKDSMDNIRESRISLRARNLDHRAERSGVVIAADISHGDFSFSDTCEKRASGVCDPWDQRRRQSFEFCGPRVANLGPPTKAGCSCRCPQRQTNFPIAVPQRPA